MSEVAVARERPLRATNAKLHELVHGELVDGRVLDLGQPGSVRCKMMPTWSLYPQLCRWCRHHANGRGHKGVENPTANPTVGIACGYESMICI